MTAVMELEWVPQERQHPRLAGLTLRPIEDVLNDPEAQRRELRTTYEEDPDFRAHVAVMEKGYGRMLENGSMTEPRAHALIDHLYADEAIESHADYLESHEGSNPYVHFDIAFCTYLDLAMPIEPNDTVTPNQAHDGKRYWIDYIWREGEHLYNRRRQPGISDLPDEPEQAPNKSRSEKLKESLADAQEVDKRLRFRNSLTTLGGAAAIASVEIVPVPDLANKVGVIAGAGAIGLAGLHWAGRKLGIDTLRHRIEDAQKEEALQALLPKISPNVTVSQASRGLQYELETLRVARQTETASLDSFEEEMAIETILEGLWWAKFANTSVDHLYWLTRELAGHTLYGNKSSFHDKRFKLMTAKLNKYLPIDQTSDAVTPTDEFTGEKTWQKFAERVATDGTMDQLNKIYFSDVPAR